MPQNPPSRVERRAPPRYVPRPLGPEALRAPITPNPVEQTALFGYKFKRGYYAAAFGVVVVAGSILGAQIKTAKQEDEKRKELEAAALCLLQPGEEQQSQIPAITRPAQTKAESTKAPVSISLGQGPERTTSPYSVDVAKQIALLEDRRALLTRQRNTYENKIAMLRERRAKKEEMERMRSPPGGR